LVSGLGHSVSMLPDGDEAVKRNILPVSWRFGRSTGRRRGVAPLPAWQLGRGEAEVIEYAEKRAGPGGGVLRTLNPAPVPWGGRGAELL